MNKIEWICTKCMWQDLEDDLVDNSCPERGTEGERPPNESMWKHFGDDYNWNKI